MLKVVTTSGAEYLFDNEQLTWERKHPSVRILYHEESDAGRLAAPVEPAIGERLTFFEANQDWVTTTAVVSITEESA